MPAVPAHAFLCLVDPVTSYAHADQSSSMHMSTLVACIAAMSCTLARLDRRDVTW
jgi:hypothetical protein